MWITWPPLHAIVTRPALIDCARVKMRLLYLKFGVVNTQKVGNRKCRTYGWHTEISNISDQLNVNVL